MTQEQAERMVKERNTKAIKGFTYYAEQLIGNVWVVRKVWPSGYETSIQ